MVKQGITAPVEGHSDWVNSLVIREKPNGRLRTCLDQRPQQGHQKRASPNPHTG